MLEGKANMTPGGKETLQTRERLLKVAARLFATEGYRGTTIADICRHARANIAAVNYHFTSKEQLYREAWRYAFQQSIQRHHPDGEIPETAPVEERLRGRIRALICRVTDRNNLEFQIVQKELAQPTGLLREVQREALAPLRKNMEALIREILGPEVSEEEIHFCQMSVMAQCLGPMAGRHGRSSRHSCQPFWSRNRKALAAYVEHVVAFSLGGLKEIRRLHESKR